MTRIVHQIGLTVSGDADDVLSAFSRDIANPALKVVSDRFTDYQVGSISLPSDGTVLPLSFGALTDVRGYYIEVLGAGACKLWINAEAPVTQDTPGGLMLRSGGAIGSSSQRPAHSYQDAGVTSLALAATEGYALSGAYVVWGFIQPQAGG